MADKYHKFSATVLPKVPRQLKFISMHYCWLKRESKKNCEKGKRKGHLVIWAVKLLGCQGQVRDGESLSIPHKSGVLQIARIRGGTGPSARRNGTRAYWGGKTVGIKPSLTHVNTKKPLVSSWVRLVRGHRKQQSLSLSLALARSKLWLDCKNAPPPL